MPMPRPKPWNTGITESIFILEISSRVKPEAAEVCNARALKFRLESMMPLVVPVVPPE